MIQKQFKRILIVIAVTLLDFHDVTAEDRSKIVAGYFENYAHYQAPSADRAPFSIEIIDTELLTDLYYAFAYIGFTTPPSPEPPHLTGDYSLQATERKDETLFFGQLLKLKQKSKNRLKTFLTVGGWNFNNPKDPQGIGQQTYKIFSQMVARPENRKQFIESAITYLHRFNFNGLDIDWEYPGDLSRGGSKEDFDNFILLLKECQTAFQQTTPPLLLSYTAPPHAPQGLPTEYQEEPNRYFAWLAKCSAYVDRINVMGYDYHTPYIAPKITGVNAPLHRDTNPLSPYFIARTLDNYLNNGVPPEKLLLGLPVFGHSYAGVTDLSETSHGPGKSFEAPGAEGAVTKQKGFLAYFEIADKMAQKQLFFGVDPLTTSVYGYHLQSKEWVSFDSPDTIKLKAQLAHDKGLRGVILWAIDLDEYQWKPTFPNLKSAAEVFIPK